MNGHFCAIAMLAQQVQGEWSRNLNTALEALLNRLLEKGILSVMVAAEDEPNQEAAPDVKGPDPFRGATVGTLEPAPNTKTRKKKLGP